MTEPIELKPGQQIYYHVGLGKAASTYLQHDVFPVLKGIHYVKRRQYKRHASIVPGLNDSKILLSRENSQRLEAETGKLAAFYPHAIPVVVLRRHDGWIASQYRRYVKNGGVEGFDNFFDITEDRGVWKQSELVLYDKLKILERHFGRPPVVLVFDSLREDPLKLVDEFCALLDASYDPEDINLSPRHRSWSDDRLLFLRQHNSWLFNKDAAPGAGKARRWWKFRLRLLTSYAVMGASSLFARDQTETLVPKDSLARIRAHYEEDWTNCLAYAAKHNSDAVKSVRS